MPPGRVNEEIPSSNLCSSQITWKNTPLHWETTRSIAEHPAASHLPVWRLRSGVQAFHSPREVFRMCFN